MPRQILSSLGDSLFLFASSTGIYQVLEAHPYKLVGFVTDSPQQAIAYYFYRLSKIVRPQDRVRGDWVYKVSDFNSLVSNSTHLKQLAKQAGLIKGHRSTGGMYYINNGQAYVRFNTDVILEQVEGIELSEFTFHEVRTYKDTLKRVLYADNVTLDDVKALKASGKVKHGPYRNGLSVFLSFNDGRVINSGPDYLQFIPRRADSWWVVEPTVRKRIVEKLFSAELVELPLYIIRRGEYAIYYNPDKGKFETALYEDLIQTYPNIREVEEILDTLNRDQLEIVREIYQLKTPQEAGLVYLHKILARRN